MDHTATVPTRFTLSDEERELLPTDDEVQFYRDHGWYVSRKLLSDEEIDLMADAADGYYAGHRDRVLPVRPPNLTYWEPSHGDVFRNNDYIWYESDVIGRIVSKPVISAVAARLAETDQIRMLNCTLFYKPPRPEEPSGVVPWHVDKHYWNNHTSDKLLTATIPFHDLDDQNGGITMIDASHKWAEAASDEGTKHFIHRDAASVAASVAEIARANGAEIREVVMRMAKGQMSFHSCLIYHGSGPNRSATPRRSLGLHLQDRDNTWREHRLSTGEILSYNHDVLVRRNEHGHPDYSDPTFCPVLWDGRL